MNCLKRACYSILHNLKSNILLVLLFTAIATLVLSGFCIRSATVQECAAIRKKLGGEVVVYTGNQGPISGNLSLSIATKLSNFAHVKASNFIVKSTAKAKDFKAVKGGDAETKSGAANITILGVTNSQQFDSFTSGAYKLINGRHFTDKDSGKAYAIIEKDLAQQDGLKPADSITIASTNPSKKQLTYTVIGIYQNTGTEMESSGNTDTVDLPGNQILIPFSQVSLLTGSTMLNYANFEMDDPANINAFRNEEEKLNLPKNTMFNAQDYLYQQIAGPLINLNLISIVMVVGVMIAGAVILSLIVILNLKGRSYEIGVLLSLGERKQRIIAQLVLEILVPTLLAFSLSVFTGQLAAQQIGSALYSTQTQPTIVTSQTDSRNENAVVRQIQVGITANDLTQLYAVGILLILLSSAVPLMTVMQYRPKDILTRID